MDDDDGGDSESDESVHDEDVTLATTHNLFHMGRVMRETREAISRDEI